MSADTSESRTSAPDQDSSPEQANVAASSPSAMRRSVTRLPQWARTRVAIVSGVVALVVLIGLTAWAVTDGPTAMQGTMTVSGGGSTMPQRGPTAVGVCTTTLGYFDVRAGTAVTVRDSSGEIVAVGQLAPGSEGGYGSCTFPFTVTDVPASDFYTVEVGRRGAVTFTAADVASGSVRLSLGGY